MYQHVMVRPADAFSKASGIDISLNLGKNAAFMMQTLNLQRCPIRWLLWRAPARSLNHFVRWFVGGSPVGINPT